jgi:hypothetical protein
MDIYAKPGTKVIFEGNVSEAQIRWGSNSDPAGILVDGQEYTIDHTEVHSYHTKVFLVGFPGKSFNSAWFQ